MRQDSDQNNRRSRRSAAAVLCLLFAILVLPVFMSTQGTLGYGATDIKYPTSELGDQRNRPNFLWKKMVRAGHLGRKSGRGFYTYED